MCIFFYKFCKMCKICCCPGWHGVLTAALFGTLVAMWAWALFDWYSRSQHSQLISGIYRVFTKHDMPGS